MPSTPSRSPRSPRLAITLGDPAGIGPEIILKALTHPSLPTLNAKITLIGSQSVLQNTYQTLRAQGLSVADPAHWPLIDVPLPGAIALGQGTASSGDASFQYLQLALDKTLAGDFEAIVTAPIAKAAWKAAGHAYPGQTEVLAKRAGVTNYGMFFVGESPYTGFILRTLLATTHIPLRSVPEALHPELLTNKLCLLIHCLTQDFGLTAPTIAVAGLNPHSGEQGQLGREEQDWLIPWLATMRQTYPQVNLLGPVPPDTLWVQPAQAWYRGINSSLNATDAMGSDAYLALYHDQGLIPVKALAFDQAVNTTIGLPFVRTSPDHGTAFDIAGTGQAKANSFIAALQWAARLADRRL